MNEELRHIGYALTVIIFIGLLVFAACGDLREKSIDAHPAIESGGQFAAMETGRPRLRASNRASIMVTL